MKYLGFLCIAVVLVASGWLLNEYLDGPIDLGSLSTYFTQSSEETVDSNTSEENEGAVLCAQVITPAINPETKEIREFPTPCDVPDGWEVIENDIPSLELEVQ